MKFHAEKAVLPGAVPEVAWVVVDEINRMQEEARTYLEALRGQSRSVNTERTYASRLALCRRLLGVCEPGAGRKLPASNGSSAAPAT